MVMHEHLLTQHYTHSSYFLLTNPIDQVKLKRNVKELCIVYSLNEY